MSLLSVSDLRVHFPVRGGILRRTIGACRAVDGVSLEVHPGETLGLIGESGCGKTTLGKTIAGLNTPTTGSILFNGRNTTGLRAGSLASDLQMIFQDPAESLNSRMTVGDIVREPLDIHKIGSPAERRQRVASLLTKVGLGPSAADRFPFEFSGGQRQRIGIARALALNPKLIICDEPVSALDVSVQSQVLNLLMDLQRESGVSYLFISHNLAVVRHISTRIAIMYLGRIMEIGPADAVTARPLHAYTRALLSAIPIPDPSHRPQRHLPAGDVPSPVNPPPGCAFGHRTNAPRYKESISHPSPMVEVSPGHWVLQCPCCTDPALAAA
jgi:peptide/nickel transport system ATP-binding protein